jgi:hypothetical protein
MHIEDLIEAQEMLSNAQEMYYEMKATALGETAMFGDAWPGANLDINNAYKCMKAWEKEVQRLSEMPLEF